MKLLMSFIVFHMLGKFVPFPFFLPFLLGVMIYAIYAAEKGMTRSIVIAMVAFQMAPLACATTKDLKDIETWGNKGPNLAPMKGVYMFDGLPTCTIDFSDCLWDEDTKVAYCDPVTGMTLYPSGSDLGAAGFVPTADMGEAGPKQDELKISMPWPMFYMFYHVALHNRIDFHFNDDLTEAQVYENVCLAATRTPSPLAYFFPKGICTTTTVYAYFRAFTIVKESGFLGMGAPTWYRNTYFNEKGLNMYEPIMVSDKQQRAGGTVYPAKMAFGDGYRLLPLLTPEGGLDKGNLAKAMMVSDCVVIGRDY